MSKLDYFDEGPKKVASKFEDQPVDRRLDFFDEGYRPKIKTPKKESPTLTAQAMDWLIKRNAVSPTTAGVLGLMGDFAEKTMPLFHTLDMVPWAKYLRSADREEFSKMSPTDQTKALLWEDLMFALYIPGSIGAAAKGVGKVTRPLGKAASKVKGKILSKPKIKPVEDIFEFGEETYKSELLSQLRGAKFKENELEGIYGYLQGDKMALADMLLEKTINKNKLSKSLAGVLESAGTDIKEISKMPRKFQTLIKDFPTEFNLSKTFIESYRPEQLQTQALRNYFTKALGKRNIFGSGYKPNQIEAAFKAQATKFYGKEAATHMTFREATAEQLANFTSNMLKDPRAVRLSAQTPVGSIFRPVRHVFGTGEVRGLGTFTNIYKKALDITANRNTYIGFKIETFQAMLQQRGLMQRVYKGGSYHMKNTKAFTNEVRQKAHEVLQASDELLGRARELQTPEAIAKARSDIQALMNPLDPDYHQVKALVSTVHDYFDLLYAERSIWKIQDIFSKLPLTRMGREGFEATFAKIAPRIEATFSTGKSLNYEQRISDMTKILSDMKSAIPITGRGASPWFKAEGPELEAILQNLNKSLTYADDGSGFMSYLENYIARISTMEQGITNEVFSSLATPQSPFFAHQRSLAAVEAESIAGLEELINARTAAQAKEMFMYKGLREMADHASKLPESWRGYTEHFMARLMGLPSKADLTAAKVMESTVGAITGSRWDAQRIMKLGKDVNDFTYMGFLGFKPFSAMRNLFQPLITVPADLGGIKDFTHLARGLKDIKHNKPILDQIGIIAEYIPEQSIRTNFLNAPKKLERFYDAGLWMFQASDRFNRYLTGSSALTKWNLARGTFTNIDSKTISKFMKKSGVNGRHPWIKNQIETLLLKGKIDDARNIFVKDVVADTQFLYGKLDSPLVGQQFGAIGKTATIFQSWWMNYGSLLHKWATTGDAGTKANRTIGWVLSSAVAYEMMKPVWGKETALRTTGFGPFPDPSRGFPVPPSWKPVGDALKLFYSIPGSVAYGDSKESTKNLKALADSTTNFLPGALQIKKMYKGMKEEGGKGLAKSLVGFPLKK